MKKILLLLVLFISTLSLHAIEIKELFIDIPDSYIPQLENEWRKDLVDLYQSGKEARLQNLMGGFSTLENLTTDYLFLQTTERSTIELKMLPLVNNTYIICMVTTVYGPVADSRVEFYTTDWQPLDAAELFTPVTGDWFIKEGVDRTANDFLYASSFLNIDLIQYKLSPDNQTMIASYMTPDYLGRFEQELIKPFLKDISREYVWKRYSFQ